MCGRWDYVFYDLDGHPGYEDVTWPPPAAATRHMEWGPSIDDGQIPGYPDGNDNQHQQYTEAWSDGTALNYLYRTLFSMDDQNHQTWVGTASAGGLTAAFSIERHDASDVFSINYSDGTKITLTVPHRVITNVTMFAPDFAAGATGTITGPAGAQTFTMAGQNFNTQQPDGGFGYWTSLVLTVPDGITKTTVDLAGGFAGNGQIAKAGQLVGTLSWDKDVIGTLRQVGMDAAAVAPSNAARRFAVDRFIYSTAAMAAGATW